MQIAFITGDYDTLVRSDGRYRMLVDNVALPTFCLKLPDVVHNISSGLCQVTYEKSCAAEKRYSPAKDIPVMVALC